ncbi:hypothetical protein GEMRC1_010772 [Eukaryota sp. GEM-RC1]
MKEAVQMVDQARLERDCLERQVTEQEQTIKDLQSRMSQFTSLMESKQSDNLLIYQAEREGRERKLFKQIKQHQTSMLQVEAKLEKVNQEVTRLQGENEKLKVQNEYLKEKQRSWTEQYLDKIADLEQRLSEEQRSRRRLSNEMENTRRRYHEDVDSVRSRMLTSSYPSQSSRDRSVH